MTDTVTKLKKNGEPYKTPADYRRIGVYVASDEDYALITAAVAKAGMGISKWLLKAAVAQARLELRRAHRQELEDAELFGKKRKRAKVA
jgi:uncharacterized protein (DUF1778 family)